MSDRKLVPLGEFQERKRLREDKLLGKENRLSSGGTKILFNDGRVNSRMSWRQVLKSVCYAMLMSIIIFMLVVGFIWIFATILMFFAQNPGIIQGY